MTIQEFIEKAIKGGWQVPEKLRFPQNDDGQRNVLHNSSTDILLDPLAWQAVGKTGALKYPLVMWEKRGLIAPQRTFEQNMHEMVHALANGETIEDYLSTL